MPRSALEVCLLCQSDQWPSNGIISSCITTVIRNTHLFRCYTPHSYRDKAKRPTQKGTSQNRRKRLCRSEWSRHDKCTFPAFRWRIVPYRRNRRNRRGSCSMSRRASLGPLRRRRGRWVRGLWGLTCTLPRVWTNGLHLANDRFGRRRAYLLAKGGVRFERDGEGSLFHDELL